MEDGKRVRILPVTLTREELECVGATLSDLAIELGEVEVQKKEEAAQHAETIKKLRSQLAERADTLRSGQENRPVEVEDRFEFKTNRVLTIRCDTGATVAERPMTEQDRQGKLVKVEVGTFEIDPDEPATEKAAE